MAIDRWLLEQHQTGKHLPSLRFYTWSPTAISLGYHQHKYPENWQHLTWQGEKINLVHRPTGGRAVLHQGDLSYSIVTSGISGSRIQVYQKISEFLIQGWRSLGVELDYGQARRSYIHNPNCFATATAADLVTVDGAKLIGSSQLFSNGAILQHGSMRLHGNSDLFALVFGAESFTSLQLPQGLTIGMIMEALIAAAVDCFGIQFEIRDLSVDEMKMILDDV
jgi:lipoate---protein ligase